MTEKILNFGDFTLVTRNDEAHATTEAGTLVFDLKDLGDIAEWLAVAWENVAGEAYQPVNVSPNGYVSDPGQVIMVTLDTANEIAESVAERINSRRIGAYSIVERDCE